MTADLRCDFPCDDDCEADCHQAHLPIHKRRPDMCGCVTRTDLRKRYADAISAVLDKPNGIAYRGTLPAALLAVRDEELERLRALVAHYENTINWHTTCHNCAAILDSSIRDTERAEKAEASNARVAAIHPSLAEADAAQNALCPECLAPAPCKTRRALDGQA